MFFIALKYIMPSDDPWYLLDLNGVDLSLYVVLMLQQEVDYGVVPKNAHL